MDLATIRKYIAERDFDALRRNKETDDMYNTYKETVVKEWESIEDVVKTKFLGASMLVNSKGLKYAHFESQPMKYSLQENEYPYDVDKNIKHLVLWSLEPIEAEADKADKADKSDEVNIILEKEIKGNKDLCWFEQTLDKKSVKGVWHIHVFVES